MPLQFSCLHGKEALPMHQSLPVFYQPSETGLRRQVLVGTPDDQVLERPHGWHIPMRMGHLPQRVNVDLAQQVDVPQLGILSSQTASIRQRIPHCLLRIVEHHVCLCVCVCVCFGLRLRMSYCKA